MRVRCVGPDLRSIGPVTLHITGSDRRLVKDLKVVLQCQVLIKEGPVLCMFLSCPRASSEWSCCNDNNVIFLAV